MQKVKVQIRNIKPEGEPIEVVYVGHFEAGASVQTVRYDESVLTGMEGVQTKLLIGNQSLVIMRSGKITSTMKFKERYKDEFLYKMDMGALSMVIETQKLEIQKIEEGHELFDIWVNYDIEVLGSPKEANQMNIRISRVR